MARALKHDSRDEAEDKDVVEPGPTPQTALDLDRLIHERMRLGIVSALAVGIVTSLRASRREKRAAAAPEPQTREAQDPAA